MAQGNKTQEHKESCRPGPCPGPKAAGHNLITSTPKERPNEREGWDSKSNRGQAEGIEEESTQTGARLCREDVGLCRPNSPEIDQA